VILWHTGEYGVSLYAGSVPVTTIADLTALLHREPGRPRLTWYGDDGERVELSGAVLDNWVSKTTNLLVEEFDAEPGTRVLLDLPGHWRTVMWAFAAWRTGACVVLADPAGGSPADVVVTDRPDRHGQGGQVVAVSLPALARRFDGDLPAGAVDAASAVMTYGDAIGWVPAVDPASPALVGPTGSTTHADLLADAVTAAAPQPGARTALVATGADVVTRVAAVLAVDGSVVLVTEGLAATLRADDERRTRLLGSERVDDPRL